MEEGDRCSGEGVEKMREKGTKGLTPSESISRTIRLVPVLSLCSHSILTLVLTKGIEIRFLHSFLLLE